MEFIPDEGKPYLQPLRQVLDYIAGKDLVLSRGKCMRSVQVHHPDTALLQLNVPDGQNLQTQQPAVDADETVRFSLDGVEQEIDLSEKNAAKLRKALDPYVAASRRVGGRKVRHTATSSSGVDNRKVREWAKANGVPVSDRGRIARSVVQQYEASQS